MSRSRPALRPVAAMEDLESRLLLSGDVTALITSDGDLVLTGDKENNAVAITVGLAGEVVISPLDANTTINGAAAPATLTGLTGDVRMRMSDGNDQVSITGMAIPGAMRFDGGRGNNSLSLDATTVGGNLSVKNLMGNQAFSMINASSVGGSVMVNNHKGNSTTTIDSATIGGNLYIFSMKGSDQIDILNATSVAMKTKLKTGFKGADINLTGLTTAMLQIQTGKGNDTVTLDSLTVTGKTMIATGSGNDSLTVTNGLAPAGFQGPVSINTGKGNDDMAVTAAFGDSVVVNGGAGDDSLDWLALSTFAPIPVVVSVESGDGANVGLSRYEYLFRYYASFARQYSDSHSTYQYNPDGSFNYGPHITTGTVYFNNYSYSCNGAWRPDDITGDGKVDTADYTLYFNNYS